MEKTYKTCLYRKQEIDKIFEQCASIYANLDSRKLTDKKKAKAEERRLLKSVRHLDPEYLDPIIKSLD